MSAVVFSYPPLGPVKNYALTKFDAFIPAYDLSTEEFLAVIAKEKPSGLILTGKHKVSENFLQQLPESVKVIATTSVGTDHFDVPAAKKRGLILTNTPDVLTDCTADMAMLLLLNASRRVREYMDIMQSGWRQKYSQGDMLGLNLRGKTLGIFGMGRIGQALATRARAFGMNIIYCNRSPLPKDKELGAIYYKNLEDMLPHCQVLSLNAPSTPDTKAIMNDKSFSLLPDRAIFINVARGDMVDEAALIRALNSKKLYAAGLDVFTNEPDYNLDLKDFNNVFLTPHMGSATEETRTAMGKLCVDNVYAVIRGQPALSPVER